MTRPVRSPITWLGCLLALYLFVPVAAFLVRLAGSGDRGFGQPGLWGALATSAEAATVSTALITCFGVPLAFWLARSHGPVSAAVGVLVQLPLALPPVMSGIVLIYVVGPYTTLGRFFGGRLTDSVIGVVLAQTFVAAPFLIVAARSAFAAQDPALDDLAATLGHRPLARFWRVSLPGAAPGIRAGLLLTWLRALGEYGATVLLAYHPYTLPVFNQVQFAGGGLADTQAPTALALALAAVGLGLNRVRWPARLRSRPELPEARHPVPIEPTAVAFDLDITVGTFRLNLNHHASTHRLAILGPSGSGKSLTLRCLAGLLGPAAGQVSFNNRPVGAVPPESRNVGYVPQGGSLLPGRPVWQQVTFGVDTEPAVAAWWLSALRLHGLSGRLPEQLSGGQRQRVGLAQALGRHPSLLLLDEPFSSLDAPVRDELRRELRRLQQQAGLSTVLVTHDPEEAALLADEILVIDDGRILQAGPRQEVYRHPASPHVARLLGIVNLSSATVTGPEQISTPDLAVTADTDGLPAGSRVLWCVRPEHVRLDADGDYAATLVDVADVGSATIGTVALAGGPQLRLRSLQPIPLRAGDFCRVRLDPADITLWPDSADLGNPDAPTKTPLPEARPRHWSTSLTQQP